MKFPSSEKIDYRRLGEVAHKHVRWREECAPELSPTYVSGEGNSPRAMLIGEAPGAQEEMRRRPFVGQSGLMLRSLMAMAELYATDTQGKNRYHRANCWLTNVVKFRPPQNRTPTPDEVWGVRGLLLEEWIALGNPQVVIPVGTVATHAIVGRPTRPLTQIAGKLYEMESRITGKVMYIWPMIHPSFGLRNPGMRPILEKDWIRLGEWMRE